MERTTGAKPNRRGAVVLLLALILVHLALTVSTVLQDRPLIWPLHNDTIHRLGRGADFYALYHAGVNLGRGDDPYSKTPDGVTPYFFPFRYLPVVAAAAFPLTLLAPQTAYLLWVLFLEGLLAVLLFTLWKRIADLGVRLAAMGLLLVSSPYLLELYMGQCTFAAVVLCCLGLLTPSGGILFCGSVLLKPFTLAAIPALARHRRYWALGGGSILCVLLVSVPYFVGHPEQWNVFFNVNFRVAGGLGVSNYGGIQLLKLVLDDSGIGWLVHHWRACAIALRLAILLATVLLVFHSKNTSALVGAAALLLAHFLTYQHVWEHHMSAVAVLGAALLTTGQGRSPANIAIVCSMVLLALPTPFGLLDTAKDPSVWNVPATWPRWESYVLVLCKVVPTGVTFLSAVSKLCTNGLMRTRDAVQAALGARSNAAAEGI